MTKTWMIIIALGIGTFMLRSFFILLFKYVKLPDILHKILRFVPGAVLAALIFPAIFIDDHQLYVSLGNEKIIAAAVAAVVAWKTSNVIYTLIAGMVVLWLLNYL